MKTNTLFQEQSIANEKVAKGALTKVITDTISAHIATQELLTRLVVAGNSKCLECGISELAGKASRLSIKVTELKNTWKNLFGEDFPTDSLTLSLASKHFPLAVGEPSYNPYDETTWHLNPSSHPEATAPVSYNPDSMEELIEEALRGKLPSGTKIAVLNAKRAFPGTEKVFGLNPLDYESFVDFFNDVKEEINTRNDNGRSEEVTAELERLLRNNTPISSNVSPAGEFEENFPAVSLKDDKTLNT